MLSLFLTRVHNVFTPTPTRPAAAFTSTSTSIARRCLRYGGLKRIRETVAQLEEKERKQDTADANHAKHAKHAKRGSIGKSGSKQTLRSHTESNISLARLHFEKMRREDACHSQALSAAVTSVSQYVAKKRRDTGRECVNTVVCMNEVNERNQSQYFIEEEEERDERKNLTRACLLVDTRC